MTMLRIACLSLLAGLVTTGCIPIAPPPPGPGPGGGQEGDIRIRMLNQTNVALDPQLFVSAEQLGDPEAILFTPDRQIVEGIGFAGSGLIPAGDEDEVIIACDMARSIGTRGGVFRNQDTGEQLGTGQQRAFAAPLTYDCGATIVFTFRSQGDGFVTTFAIE